MKLLKIAFLFFFLVIVCFSFQEKNNIKSYATIYKKINQLNKKRKYDSALIESKKLLKISLDDLNKVAKANSKIAEFHRKLNNQDSAYYYYNKSKEAYLKSNDSINYGRILLNIAIIESNYGRYSLSDSTAVESIRFVNGKRDRTTASAYNCLAINSKRRFLFDDAIIYYTKALELSDRKSSRIKYKNNIAILYKDLREYSKSILIFEDLLQNFEINIKTKARVLDNLAYTKWLKNSTNNVLSDLLYANSQKLKNKDTYGLIASYSHLSDYLEEIDKRKSLFYAYEMYTIAKAEKSIQDQLEAIDKIIELETSTKSTKYFKESIRLRDSLQKEETKRQYKFAKIKYDYEEEEKKKLQFKALASENKLIAEQENNQKKNILIGAILLVAFLSFLFYRRKQLEKRKILEANYQTETRIAKQLHDNLGNSIFNTLTKLQKPNYNTAEILNDLDKIYLKTRAISHENDTITKGAEFEKYFKQLLANYNSKTCKIIIKDISVLELNTLREEKQIVLYRVYNELLVNMKKHSKASLVVISCNKIDNYLEINYADNGIGFENDKIVFKNGLKNMETRIKSINGTVNFESVLNKGCKIKIRFKK